MGVEGGEELKGERERGEEAEREMVEDSSAETGPLLLNL